MAKLGEHAVVLGASMGGLLAARVLADFYGMVTVFERDVLPHDPANRRGVPQGRHVHALLNRGAQLLDELFPGFLNELVAAGATVLDDGDPAKGYFSFGGHEMVRSGTVRDPEAMALYLASRPFLECHVRRRLQTVENVTILGGRDVVESTSTADRTRVTGVRVAERNGGHEHELAANLVVDATGRGSRTPTLLESLGYGRPVEDHVFVHTTYVSQLLRIPPGSLEERIVIIGATSGRPTGLFLSAYEDDAWMFTVWGMVGHEPPSDRAGMLSFARDFTPAHLLAAVRAAEPLAEAARHRLPSSQWRRYDKMRRFPDGLLVTGDAICSFNPVYGQGMTVSALDAAALRDCLRRGERDLARRYFRATAKSIGVAWQMAAGNDLGFPEVEGRRSLSTRVTNRCADWVLTACESDVVTAERFFRVNNFIDPPTRLLHPSFISRVAAVNLRRRRGDHAASASPTAR
ncbi:MAG TPA: 2-polyprenyl-6-methoxyphenol hydroxylase-like oxidoreductase [Mycobacterium sp.]|nr:2-polyprenyl-6-methoxyphenol hydroxylase-like oxidoreductase [Mycobacterium sp.]